MQINGKLTFVTSEAQMAQQQPAKRRDITRKNAWDMVRSLGLILIVVAAVFFLVPRPSTTVIPTADVPRAAEAARASGDVPVITPSVPNGWNANSAHRAAPKDGASAYWHVGYLTPAGEYVGLDATKRATEGWLNRITMNGQNIRTPVQAGGVEWETWTSPKTGRTSLVRGGVAEETVVVSGTATLDELAALAAASVTR